MSSPSKYYSSSPIRNLEDRYNSRPLETIHEQNNALRLSNSLIFHNKLLQQENERLISQYSIKKDQEIYKQIENTKLKQQRETLQHRFRSLQALSIAEKQVKDKQLQSQQRDIRFLRDQFDRQNQNLRDQVIKLSSKISSLETEKLQDMQKLEKRYASNMLQETDLVKRNLGEQLKQIFGELTVARKLLMEKQQQLQHLVNVNLQNSLQYTHNLQRLISENNILRNQLLALELQKNKEIQVVQNKKQLQKSRTIGILSYCKENNHFIQKQLTRLAEQLLEKNISIQSFTKELLKQRKQSDLNQRKFQDNIAKLKEEMAEAIADKDAQILKNQKSHKNQITDLIENNMNLQEQISSKNNQIQNTIRELEYTKHNIDLKDKQIIELKENINRMHDDHSKQLSKVMTESRVKRRSGLNMSSYSSSSLKELQEPQGSSILKGDKYERKSSFSHEGSGRLPTVKEELAVSHGQIDDDDEDIEIKQLILHYESMIEQLKKNKANEIQLKNGQIDTLEAKLAKKDAEMKQILTKFSPLMQLQSEKPDINSQRRAKIEQTQKGDISILSVLLDKYQIAALKPKNK